MGVGEPVDVDMLEEPPERRDVGHIERDFLTRPADKHATQRPRMSAMIELGSPGSEKMPDFLL